MIEKKNKAKIKMVDKKLSTQKKNVLIKIAKNQKI